MEYLPYICHRCNVFISTIMEVCSPAGKNYLFSFYHHPSLIRFLCCKVGMGYICFPYLISAFGPLHWNLFLQHKKQAIKPRESSLTSNKQRLESHLVPWGRRNQTIITPLRHWAVSFIMLHQSQIKLQPCLIY